jgi:hypothetical protein
VFNLRGRARRGAHEIADIRAASALQLQPAMTCRFFVVSILIAGCATNSAPGFVPDPDDETLDPSDPPVDPDPSNPAELLPPDDGTPVDAMPDTIPSDDELLALRASCPRQTRTLSPTGLTFAIHISKKEDEGWDAYHQLRAVRHLIRARDVFVIESSSPWVRALQKHFPCNEVHYIAYPDELDAAYAAASLLDGIIVDWEGGQVDTNPQSYSIDKLDGYASKIHGKGLSAAIAPAFPQGFDDGHIVRASNMNFDLAQIQGSCADGGAVRFAALARSLVKNFLANGESPHNLGVEISLDSFADADNHTDLARSVACSRKAYGKGVRAIYIYGNGPPHLTGYFRALRDVGLREPR